MDGVYRAPAGHLTHAAAPERAEAIASGWGRPTVDMNVNLFALSGPDGLTLVDAGTGPFWGAELGLARVAMMEAGLRPEDVRRVLLTHAHGDHVLGLLAGEAAYFPEAEVLISQAELAFYTDEAIRASLDAAHRGPFATVEKLVAAYGERLKGFASGPVLPGVEAIPMPGHTMGHTGYLVGEGEERLLLWGDLVHAPALQLADPGICFNYDTDPMLGAQSRRAILKRAADEGWVVSGGHMDGFLRLEQGEGGLRLVSA